MDTSRVRFHEKYLTLQETNDVEPFSSVSQCRIGPCPETFGTERRETKWNNTAFIIALFKVARFESFLQTGQVKVPTNLDAPRCRYHLAKGPSVSLETTFPLQLLQPRRRTSEVLGGRGGGGGELTALHIADHPHRS